MRRRASPAASLRNKRGFSHGLQEFCNQKIVGAIKDYERIQRFHSTRVRARRRLSDDPLQRLAFMARIVGFHLRMQEYSERANKGSGHESAFYAPFVRTNRQPWLW
jgi:hypothetical protein